jgi:hypothetical protein
LIKPGKQTRQDQDSQAGEPEYFGEMNFGHVSWLV